MSIVVRRFSFISGVSKRQLREAARNNFVALPDSFPVHSYVNRAYCLRTAVFRLERCGRSRNLCEALCDFYLRERYPVKGKIGAAKNVTYLISSFRFRYVQESTRKKVNFWRDRFFLKIFLPACYSILRLPVRRIAKFPPCRSRCSYHAFFECFVLCLLLIISEETNVPMSANILPGNKFAFCIYVNNFVYFYLKFLFFFLAQLSASVFTILHFFVCAFMKVFRRPNHQIFVFIRSDL